MIGIKRNQHRIEMRRPNASWVVPSQGRKRQSSDNANELRIPLRREKDPRLPRHQHDDASTLFRLPERLATPTRQHRVPRVRGIAENRLAIRAFPWL